VIVTTAASNSEENVEEKKYGKKTERTERTIDIQQKEKTTMRNNNIEH